VTRRRARSWGKKKKKGKKHGKKGKKHGKKGKKGKGKKKHHSRSRSGSPRRRSRSPARVTHTFQYEECGCETTNARIQTSGLTKKQLTVALQLFETQNIELMVEAEDKAESSSCLTT
jgi:hypothetical protein